MSKLLVIGDVHGKDCWQNIVEKESWDKIIFLGDYFDPYRKNVDCCANFNAILQFKKNNPEKVVLLLGNHDYQYLPGIDYGRYSRFNRWLAPRITSSISSALSQNLMQLAYQEGNVVFTHAGITDCWYKIKCLNQTSKTGIEYVAENINKTDLDKFRFSDASWDVYGESTDNSPLWIRDNALKQNPLKGIKQVVGHTRQSKIKSSDDKCLWWIDVLDSTEEYLSIVDGIFKVVE